MITLRQMQYFVKICMCDNNITKAAEQLYVTQPSVSTAIHSMERELGYQLFIRNGKKLILTQNGEYVFNQVSSFLENADHMVANLKKLNQESHVIKLGLPLQVGAFIMPIILGEFHKKYPDIKIEIIEEGGLECIDLLQAKKLDLVISVHDNHTFSSLEDIELFKTQYCFCVNKHHPMAKCSSVNIKDIKDEPIIMMAKTFYINKYMTNLFMKNKISPNVILYTKQLNTVKNIVGNNIASTFLMRETIINDENIIGIPIDEAEDVSVYLTINKEVNMPPETELLIKFLSSKDFR